MHRSLAARQARGAKIVESYFLALLAEAYGKVGQAEEGLSVLAEALVLVERTGERVYEAELYRLKGMLTLQSQVESHKSKVTSRKLKKQRCVFSMPSRLRVARAPSRWSCGR